MTKKEKSAVEEYMARPDLPEALKERNSGFIGRPDPRDREREGCEFDELVYFLEADEGNVAKAAELARWPALAQSPWEAPAGLLKAAAALERDYPVTVPLALAIDLMAFGDAAPSYETMSGRMEAIARRQRAGRAMFKAASQERFIVEYGADGSLIKPSQFELIHISGIDGDSLEFRALRAGEPDKLLPAAQIVEAGKFYGWLRQLASPTQRTAKRGPKFKYDWNEGKARFDQLMALNGDLDDRQDWSANADIEREIMKHMQKHGGGEPTRSSVQEKVSEWLKLFRAGAR